MGTFGNSQLLIRRKNQLDDRDVTILLVTPLSTVRFMIFNLINSIIFDLYLKTMTKKKKY